jgi:homoserine dehydrogenase
MHFRLGFIGFGNVGQGLCEILLEKKELLAKKYNLSYDVVAISDILKGSVYDENGLDIAKILEIVKRGDNLKNYPTGIKGMDSLATIKETNANVIVEVTYTNIETGEPALTHIKTALQAGKNVISTNKGPVIKEASRLLDIADSKGVYYGFEGVVLAGTPALNLAKVSLSGNNITGFRGILNGTTNFILSKMEEGIPYKEALKKAQELGLAEVDPSNDVEGFDAVGKVVILTNVVLGKKLRWEDVKRKGIKDISLQDIKRAQKEGYRFKLIGSSKILSNGSVEARVWPEKLPLSDPLAGVSNATNALTYYTDELGSVTIIGPGAGRRETGSALLYDLLELNRRWRNDKGRIYWKNPLYKP